jgi:hypothetical protein
MATRKRTAARKTTAEQRIAEYVDSPMMRQRVRQGKQISARIHGNYGVYRTQVSTTKKVTGYCTCPSDWQPCKHIHALRETWAVNPKSFFDLDQWLAELFDQPKAKLIDAIAKIVMRSPECLGEFGVPGFEEDEDDDENEEYEEEDWYDE